MNPTKKSARIAGLVYLMVIACGFFAQIVRMELIVADDAAATADNITSAETLFRMGFVSDLVMMTAFLLLPLALYRLLKPVNEQLAFLMVLFVAVSIPINAINLLNEFAALHLLSGADYLQAVGADQLQAQAMLSLELYGSGYLIAQIFFGLWLFPLGLLVYKSGSFPRMLGVLLMVACVALLLETLTIFLAPDYEAVTYPGLAVAAMAEVSFCLWLLIRGANPASSAPALAAPALSPAH